MGGKGKIMAKNNAGSIFYLILNLAVGTLLAIGGIWAINGGGDLANLSVFANSTLRLVFGIIELICGLFIILSCFIGDKFGTFGNILKIIVLVVWIIAAVCDLARGSLFSLEWLYRLALDIIVLFALFITRG